MFQHSSGFFFFLFEQKKGINRLNSIEQGKLLSLPFPMTYKNVMKKNKKKQKKKEYSHNIVVTKHFTWSEDMTPEGPCGDNCLLYTHTTWG